jgi:hypothetical protein
MDSLPFRATIFMRPVGLHCGQLELMERHFAQEADAVFWCKVMTEAEPHATGAWMVARSRGGRRLEMTHEQGLGGLAGLPQPVDDHLAGVLAGAGMPAEPGLAPPVALELVGSA